MHLAAPAPSHHPTLLKVDVHPLSLLLEPSERRRGGRIERRSFALVCRRCKRREGRERRESSSIVFFLALRFRPLGGRFSSSVVRPFRIHLALLRSDQCAQHNSVRFLLLFRSSVAGIVVVDRSSAEHFGAINHHHSRTISASVALNKFAYTPTVGRDAGVAYQLVEVVGAERRILKLGMGAEEACMMQPILAHDALVHRVAVKGPKRSVWIGSDGAGRYERLAVWIVISAANAEDVVEVLVVLLIVSVKVRSSPNQRARKGLTWFSALVGASERGDIEQQEPAPIRAVPQSHLNPRRLKSSTRSCSPWHAIEQAAQTAELWGELPRRQVVQA